MSRSVASVLLCFALPLVAIGQARLENCDLSVHVRVGNEQTTDTPIQVEVLGPAGVIKSAQVVGDPAVHFQVGSGKTYRLHVTGSSIEAVTTPFFDIEPLEQSHEETVNVRMIGDNAGTKVRPGTSIISASEMTVPKKASEAMKKGLAAYSRGEMEKAAGYFAEAAADYPRYARAYDLLGAIAMKSSDRAKAREMFTRSLDVDETYVPAYVSLARLDVQGQQYADAELLLDKAITLDPAQPAAMALRAMAEFANHQYDQALADVERTHALRDHEQYAEVHALAGKVLRMQNRLPDAIAQFKLFLAEKPDSPEAPSVRDAVASLEAAGRH